MSHTASNWAWEQTAPSAPAKTILVYLAKLTDEQGESYPSFATICTRTQIAPMTVRKALKQLVAANFLEIVPQFAENGRQRVNIYRLPFSSTTPLQNKPPYVGPTPSADDEDWRPSWGEAPKSDPHPIAKLEAHAPSDLEDQTPLNLEGDPQLKLGANTSSVSKESKEEPSLRSGRVRAKPLALVSNQRWEAAFAEFYRLYPRHVAPDRAHKAFVARMKEGVDPADIIAGVHGAIAAFANRTPDRIPYPATWLNDGAWRDAAPDTFDPALRAVGFTPETYAQAQRAQQQSFPLALTGGKP